MTTDPLCLDGHRPGHHPLAIRHALESSTLSLARYAPQSLWAQDTMRLPWPLRRFRARARRFAQQELRPLALEADLNPHDPERDQALLKIAGRAGYMTDMLPMPWGSRPWHLFRYPLQWLTCLKAEELCAACGGLGLFLAAHVLGSAPILLTGDLGTIAHKLVPIYKQWKRGEPHVMAFAITEPTAGSDVEETHGADHYRPRCIATRVPGGYRLNGRKVYISGGDVAQGYTLFASIDSGGMDSWTCFYVRRSAEGFGFVRNEIKMGQRASGAAELELDNVLVADKDVVGEPGKGWALNRVTLNFSRMPVAAIALGIARGAMESAMDFACTQKLAGKALIHYQEVQLGVAQMLAETTAMRAMIWHAAREFTPTQAMASMTKFHCGDRALKVCEMAMDLMGNHGVLHSHYAEKGFRDARLTQIYEGTNQINRLAVIEDQQEQFLTRLAQHTGKRVNTWT